MPTYFNNVQICGTCVYWCGPRDLNSAHKTSEADMVTRGKCSNPRTPHWQGSCSGDSCNEYEVHPLLRD